MMNFKFLSDETLNQKRSNLALARRSSNQLMKKSFSKFQKSFKNSDRILMQGFEIFRKKKIIPEEEKTVKFFIFTIIIISFLLSL